MACSAASVGICLNILLFIGKWLAGVLSGALLLGVGPLAMAATANYNDGSVTGGSAEWQAWVSEWESVANDYTGPFDPRHG